MNAAKRTRHRGPPDPASPTAPNAAAPNAAAPSAAPLPVRPGCTLADYAREWLKLRDKRTRQPDTARLRDHFLPILGNVRVRELSSAQLLEVVQKTLAKKGMTPKSARNAYAVFAELIGDALERGFIETDPRALPSDIWPEDETARPVFDDDEVWALENDERIAEPQRMYHRLAFGTGLSSAALSALTFGNWRQALQAAPAPELEVSVEAWRTQGFERTYGRVPTTQDRLLPRPGNSPEPHTEGSAFKAFRRACVSLGIKTRSPAAVRNTYEARREAARAPAAS